MKNIRHNITALALLCLFGGILFPACKKHDNIIPTLEGRPAGGVLSARVSAYSGNEATVCIDLFATNQFGTLLSNLETNCFELQNDDDFTSEWITLTRRDNVNKGPYSAMLLFDQSGSIEDTDPTDARVAAGLTFVDALGAGDEIAISVFAGGSVHYADDLEILTGFSSDKSILNREVESLAGKAQGGTPLYASIYELLPYIRDNAQNTNKALIVFTDGEDTDGGASINQIITDALAFGIEVYVIGLSDAVNNSDLSDIALETGGSLMWATDAAQLVSLYNTLADLLKGRGQYYETCIRVTKQSGNWVSGETALYYIRLPFPGGFVVEYPVKIRIP